MNGSRRRTEFLGVDLSRIGVSATILVLLLAFLGCGEDKETGPPPPPPDLPDLQVLSVASDPELPLPGEGFDLRLVVANIGTAPSAETEAVILIDQVAQSTHLPVAALDPGHGDTLALAIPSQPEGLHTLRACVDDSHRVREGIETNNCRDSLVIVQFPTQTPDLLPDSVYYEPWNPTTAQEITLRIRVANRGPGAAPPTTLSIVLNGGTAQASIAVPAVAADSSVLVSSSLGRKEAGDYSLTVCVDPDTLIAEADEANNCRTRSMVVREVDSLPDLVCAATTFAPALPGTQEEIVIRVEVKNRGNATARASRTGIRVGDLPMGEGIETPIIGAGGTATVTVALPPLDAGYHAVTACADLGDVVEESAEGNNCRLDILTVLQNPPSIPFPPVPDSLDFHSDSEAARSAQAVANQEIRLAGGLVMTNMGDLQPLSSVAWSAGDSTCWRGAYVYGSCDYLVDPCRAETGIAWTITRSGLCGGEAPDTGTVAVSGTTDVLGLWGLMNRIGAGTGTIESAWTWDISAEGIRTWRFYSGSVGSGNLQATAVARASGAGTTTVWTPAGGAPWDLELAPGGSGGRFRLYEAGTGRLVHEIAWTPDGGTWTVHGADGSVTTRTW